MNILLFTLLDGFGLRDLLLLLHLIERLLVLHAFFSRQFLQLLSICLHLGRDWVLATSLFNCVCQVLPVQEESPLILIVLLLSRLIVVLVVVRVGVVLPDNVIHHACESLTFLLPAVLGTAKLLRPSIY